MKYYYICAGNNVCGKCSKNCFDGCYYSSEFKNSKLFNQGIKPITPITFIRDERGNFWEVNWDWDKNLPKEFRSKPEEMIQKTYDEIEGYELFNAGRRAANATFGKNKILF